MARSDVQLMLDVKAGDEQSFALLLQRYRRPLVNFLYRMVREREEAEDLAQEVFLRVYRARKDYVPSAKFTTWLFRIATNLALNSLRDNRYQRMEVSIDAPVSADAQEGDERTLDVAEKRPNIEQHLIEEARRTMIRRAVEELPEKQRRTCRSRSVRRMVGEGGQARAPMAACRRTFCRFPGSTMGRGDGPASAAFAGGTGIGAVLARNDLRSSC